MSDSTQEYIDEIPLKDWMKLIDLIPEIEQTSVFGEIVTSSTEDEIFFPYMKCSELVSKFHQLVYDLNMVIVFDWMKWEEGKDILENGKENYSKYDLITLIKLITTIVRNDRFSEGYLVTNFEDGTILKILKRIQSIINK